MGQSYTNMSFTYLFLFYFPLIFKYLGFDSIEKESVYVYDVATDAFTIRSIKWIDVEYMFYRIIVIPSIPFLALSRVYDIEYTRINYYAMLSRAVCIINTKKNRDRDHIQILAESNQTMRKANYTQFLLKCCRYVCVKLMRFPWIMQNFESIVKGKFNEYANMINVDDFFNFFSVPFVHDVRVVITQYRYEKVLEAHINSRQMGRKESEGGGQPSCVARVLHARCNFW